VEEEHKKIVETKQNEQEVKAQEINDKKQAELDEQKKQAEEENPKDCNKFCEKIKNLNNTTKDDKAKDIKSTTDQDKDNSKTTTKTKREYPPNTDPEIVK